MLTSAGVVKGMQGGDGADEVEMGSQCLGWSKATHRASLQQLFA